MRDAQAMNICITVIERNNSVTSFVFEKGEVTMGRSSSNDLRFDAIIYEQISRNHGRVALDRFGGLFYEDLGSKHGSFIDGKAILGKKLLERGDAVRISPDGPVISVMWPQERVTGHDGTHLRSHVDSPYFPLCFSEGFIERFHHYEKLAAGGFGEIWKATPKDGSTPVAIKLLHPMLLNPEHIQTVDRNSLVRRFAREARIQHLLSESGAPATVKVHSWGDDPFRDYLYIIMDLIDGRSFDRVIISEGLMSQDRVIRYMLPIVRALEAAHSFEFVDDVGKQCRGVVHRDVKPNNILIEAATDEPKLLDFGVAGIIQGGDRLTMNNVTVGTLQYLPPESLQSGELGAATDLWGFAVTMYLALSGGRFPYDGYSKSELLGSLELGKIVPIRAHRVDLDIRLCDALMFSLSPAPERRLQTAREWIELLEEIQSGK